MSVNRCPAGLSRHLFVHSRTSLVDVHSRQVRNATIVLYTLAVSPALDARQGQISLPAARVGR